MALRYVIGRLQGMTPERIERVRQTLAELDADALILTSPANRRWATGFTSASEKAFSTDIAVITPDNVDLLVSPIHVEWARGESPVATSVNAHKGHLAAAVTEYSEVRDLRSIAIESDALPYPDATALLKALPGLHVEFVTALREQWRASKDAEELELLERGRARD